MGTKKIDGNLEVTGSISSANSPLETTANKVTSLSNSSTDTQYPSAKAVYDDLQDVREVAEGKCKTYVLSHEQGRPESYLWEYYHYYDFTTNTIKPFESQQHLTNWLNGLTYSVCLNSSFNSNNGLLQLSLNGYLVFTSLDNQSGVIVYLPSTLSGTQEIFFKKGDIFLVVETEVPDRWYDSIIYSSGRLYFYKLETSKIDLSNYAQKNADETITGQWTFADLILDADSEFQLRSGAWFSGDLKIDGNIIPLITNDVDLGSSSYYWKDLYLSGSIKLGNFNICLNSIGGLVFEDLVNYRPISFTNNLQPRYDNVYSLGDAALRWKNLYLSGNLSDGTDSVAISEILTSNMFMNNTTDMDYVMED